MVTPTAPWSYVALTLAFHDFPKLVPFFKKKSIPKTSVGRANLLLLEVELSSCYIETETSFQPLFPLHLAASKKAR